MLVGAGSIRAEEEKAVVSPAAVVDAYQHIVASNKECNNFSIKFNEKRDVMGVLLKDSNKLIIVDLNSMKVLDYPKQENAGKITGFSFNARKVVVKYSSWLGKSKSHCVDCCKKRAATKGTKKIDIDALDDQRAVDSAAILEKILTGNKDCETITIKYGSKNQFIGILLHDDANAIFVYDLQNLQKNPFILYPPTKIGDFEIEISKDKNGKETNLLVLCYADVFKSKEKVNLDSDEYESTESKTGWGLFPAKGHV